MTGATNKAKEMSFIENAGDVTVKVNGVSVEIHADGSILAYTNRSVKVCPPANDAGEHTAPADPRIGQVMDGAILAGFSPETGKPMYTTPADAPLTYTFNGAKEYAAKLDAEDLDATGQRRDWHVPSKAELNVLFNNRAAIGGFNVSGSYPAGWYWSASQDYPWDASVQRFSDGAQSYDGKGDHLSVRCVR